MLKKQFKRCPSTILDRNNARSKTMTKRARAISPGKSFSEKFKPRWWDGQESIQLRLQYIRSFFYCWSKRHGNCFWVINVNIIQKWRANNASHPFQLKKINCNLFRLQYTRSFVSFWLQSTSIWQFVLAVVSTKSWTILGFPKTLRKYAL